LVVFLTDIKLFQCVQESTDPGIQSFDGVASSVVHENYNPAAIDWDIAIIELPSALMFNDYVQPVCLPSSPVADGTKCVVTGWGDTKGNHQRTSVTLHSISL